MLILLVVGPVTLQDMPYFTKLFLMDQTKYLFRIYW